MQQANVFFVTGNDTECGKTYVSLQLLKIAKQQGLSAVAFKPLSCGAELTVDGLRNEDALLLQAAGSERLPYDMINPFAYEQPISPNLAANDIVLEKLANRIQSYVSLPYDLIIVEGIGGCMVPLNQQHTLLDLMSTLNIPVILVVGMVLGCLNHSLLSYHALQQANIPVLGWVANKRDPDMLAIQGNINTLKQRIAQPCLGELNYKGEFSPAVLKWLCSETSPAV